MFQMVYFPVKTSFCTETPPYTRVVGYTVMALGSTVMPESEVSGTSRKTSA